MEHLPVRLRLLDSSLLLLDLSHELLGLRGVERGVEACAWSWVRVVAAGRDGKQARRSSYPQCEAGPVTDALRQSPTIPTGASYLLVL